MATATEMSCICQVGETAGSVWRLLKKSGPLSIAKIIKEVDAPRDLVMLALGWLAREDKISIAEEGRSKVVSLSGAAP